MTGFGRGERDALAAAARIRAGNENFKGSRRNLGGSREVAALALAPRVHRTAEGAAEQVRLEAGERAAASRETFRRLMMQRHGCTGRDCASDRHEGDLGELRMALYALGLRPDPQVVERDQWGDPVKPGKRCESLTQHKQARRRLAPRQNHMYSHRYVRTFVKLRTFPDREAHGAASRRGVHGMAHPVVPLRYQPPARRPVLAPVRRVVPLRRRQADGVPSVIPPAPGRAVTA